jgi:AAA15 family ATPase/GTPase
MHRLSQVRIQNYKSIKDLDLKLTDYTPLVGYNNAGKSNILEAMPLVRDYLKRRKDCRQEYEALLEAIKHLKNTG